MKILRASIEDVPFLAPLLDAYRVFYGRPSDLQVAEHFLRDRISANESVIFFGRQLQAGSLTGFTQLYPSFSSVSVGRFWILNDLFVTPESRRSGVARKLIQAAHGHARETGALRVALSTTHSNHSAQALHESIGYVRGTEFRSYSFPIRNTTP